jgi:cytoskeletal protein CcmA (bactofilin family)
MTRFDGHVDDHVDEMTCLLYLDAQLESDLARNLAAHVEACADCRRLLNSLERESQLLHESLVEEDEAVPARLRAPARAENISWGWIGAAGVAAAGLYGLWNAVAEPWINQMRQVGIGQDSLLTVVFFSGVFWKGWGDMLNVIEVLSVAAIAAVLFVLLRRNLRRLVSLSAAFFLLSMTGLVFSPVASAAEHYHSNTASYVLPPGTTVHSDLVVGAPSARIDGTVEGDVVAFARSVVVAGHVAGDLIAWAQNIRIDGKVDGSCICGAQTLRINGQVGGSVRAFAQVVLVEGEVSRNLMAWVQKVEISTKGRVSGSLLAFAETIVSDGRIEHDLTARSDETDLNGYVGGNAALRSSQLTIGPSAEIRGTASYRGEHKPDVSPQAKLASPLTVELISRWDRYRHLHYYWVHIVLLSAAFVLGLVFQFLLTGFFGRVVRKSARIGVSIGYGAVVLVATPILAILACLTLVGIPLAVTALMAYIVALYSAQIVVGTWVGEKLLGTPTGTGARIGRMALGLALLRVFFAVPLVKVIAWGIVLPMGLGAVVLAIYDGIRSAAEPAPAIVS